jgi:hypothetical protein
MRPPRTSSRDYTEATPAFYAAVVAAVAALLAVLAATAPLTFWEYDELLFAGAVERFDPLVHHPHPPGYPVFVGLGKIANLILHDPFNALVAVSAALTVVGFLAAVAAFRRLLRDSWLGLSAAVLFYASAGMLVDATLPLSDASAIAFLAVWQMSRPDAGGSTRDALIGAFASLAVGCRPQLAVMVLPMLALFLALHWSVRRAGIVLGTFAVLSTGWLLPLVVATGGLHGFVQYQLTQASDFAANDADLARSGWRWTMLVLAFVAHPWGNKLLSTPVLGLAGLGALALLWRRAFDVAPFVVAAGIYLAFAGFTMDPIDSVRYALPATLAVALLASAGLGALLSLVPGGRRSYLALACALVAAAGSFRYAAPVIRQRHLVASPPVQAAEYARNHLPAGAVILFERPLQPHAQQLFSTFESAPLGEDFGAYVERGRTPVYVLADGGSTAAGGVSFTWRDSDAYGKLTRNHYRVVSLVPVPPERRYRAIRGVYRPERTVEGTSWRWLAPSAAIALPDVGARLAAVRLAVPDDYPWPSLAVTVRSDAQAATAEVRPGAPADVVVALGRGGPSTIAIESERTFVPADAPELLQHDRRQLGVMLLSVEQRP